MATHASIAVVGGGIVGASIAWRLAQADCRVTLFEAHRIGGEASWAGAGMLAPGGEFDKPGEWSEFAIHSLSLYPDYVAELSRISGVAIDFRQCGAFELAFSGEEATALLARAAERATFGVYSEQFPASRIPGIQEGVVAAQYYPFDSVVNPREIMQALHIACRREGVRICERTAVRDLSGNLQHDAVVIAAGAWGSQFHIPGVTLPQAFPVKGHLIAFDEDTGLCDAIVRHRETYLLRRANNTVVAGASTEHRGFDRAIDGRIAQEVAERAAALIPALDHVPYTAWTGLRPASESGNPVLGRVAGTNTWLAYGHYRNGILMAPATAERIAREICTGAVKQASSQMDLTLPAAHLK